MLAGYEKFKYDMFLDSGAFTARQQGVTIELEDYARFLHLNQHMFAACSSLDVIGGSEQANWDNFQALIKEGCRVQPVFHVREDPRWLVKYMDNYDYILIGGMVPETTKWLKKRLDGLFYDYLTNKDGTPKVKLHGFGLTDQLLMFLYPWYSVDSTSWMFAGMYGGVTFLTDRGLYKVVFSEHNEHAKHIEGWHYNLLTDLERQAVDKMLAPHGLTVQQCRDSHNYRNLINCRTFQEMEVLGTNKFKREEGLF
jgi:hypothetical protein